MTAGGGIEAPARAAVAIAAVAALSWPAAADARRNLYVGADASHNVGALDIATDGSLSPVGTFPTAGMNVRGVTMTPDGAHLYAANTGANNVAAFSVTSTGALTTVAGSPFGSTVSSPRGAAVAPDGQHLYVVNGGGNAIAAFEFGASGGILPIAGSPYLSGPAVFGLAMTPDGRYLYATSGSSIYGFAVGSGGVLSALPGPTLATPNAAALAVTPDGQRLYVTGVAPTNQLNGFTIGADGALTPIAGLPRASGANPLGIGVTPDGRHLYVTNLGDANVSGFDIGATGALTPTADSPVTTGSNPADVATTPDGKHLYVSRENNFIAAYDVDAAGTLTPITDSPFQSGVQSPSFESLAVTPDQGPTAAFTASPLPSEFPSVFDASASSDPDGTVARYDWDFGDGQSAPDGGPTPSHTYLAPGSYTVTLVVSDNEGCSTTFVYTGQVASCNGGAKALARQVVSVPDANDPVLRLTGRRTQKLGRVILVGARCDEACTVTAQGSIAVRAPNRAKGRVALAGRRSFKLKPVGTNLAADQRLSIRLRVPKRARKSAANALSDGGGAVARLSVVATDGSGNAARAKRRVKLR